MLAVAVGAFDRRHRISIYRLSFAKRSLLFWIASSVKLFCKRMSTEGETAD